MTLRDLILFFAWFILFSGLGKIYTYWLLHFTFSKSSSNFEFFEFCNSKEISKFKFKSNRGVYKKTILRGCLLVFFGLIIFILYFLIMQTEYANYLTYKI